MTTCSRAYSRRWRSGDGDARLLGQVIVAVAVAVAILSCGVIAAEIDPTPRLQVEVGTHTAMIRRMHIDETSGIAITASDDKTIRLWSLAKERLLRTIRIPIGDDNEGRLFALAVHDRLIAVGGWTGIEWEGASAVYLISAENGKILRRIAGFPGAIGYLKFSTDGSVLAVGMFGGGSLGGGIQFLDVHTGRRLGQDMSYGDRVWGIDHHADRGFVTTSYDGFVRLYGTDYLLRKKKGLTDAGKPSDVKFSPNGKQLAVGFVDSPRVAIVDADSLEMQHDLTPDGSDSSVNLPGVTWSADGQVINAIGDSGDSLAYIYQWSRTGGALSPIPVDARRLTAIETLQDGRIVLGTEDPKIIVLRSNGSLESTFVPKVIQFKSLAKSLLVSADGRKVGFRRSEGSGYSVFSVSDQTLVNIDGLPAAMFPATTVSPRLQVTEWEDRQIVDGQPLINGVPVFIDRYNVARAVALAENGRRVLFGTDWGMYLFDNQATLIWKNPTPYVVWGVNVSRNEEVFVAALSDGTLRWYSLDDGREILAAYFHPSDEEWIAWIPSGHYTSSPSGDQYIGWHVNRSVDETPDFYRAVQFERALFRPDLVQSQFATLGRSELPKPDLLAIAPPRVDISRLETKAKKGVSKAEAVFDITVEMNSQPMLDYAVYVNNIPVTPAQQRLLSDAERKQFKRQISVDLKDPDNLIRVEVFNGRSMGLLEQYVEGPTKKLEPPKGDLYLFAVGINKFDNKVRCADPELSHIIWETLDAGAADAIAIRDAFVLEEGRTFAKVHTRLLSDVDGIDPTKSNIEREIDFIKEAGPNDTVIIFLASHGLTNIYGNYFFVPRDGSVEDGCRLTENRNDIETLVGWKVFFDVLRVTAGRRIMIVDTCHAGDMQVANKFDAFSLTKRSTASSFALMSAAKGNQESQEYADGAQGLFTYGVLEALRMGVDYDGDGWTTLREVFDFSLPFVVQNAQIDQTPVLVDPEPLGSTRLRMSDPRLRRMATSQ